MRFCRLPIGVPITRQRDRETGDGGYEWAVVNLPVENLKIIEPSRTFFPQEIPVMLHRSPSGAKRKIRQRREEQGSRPSPFLPAATSSSSPTPSTTVPSESNYRSLIDSGAYQSILPDFDSSSVPVPQPR
ncbi:hypothetical protein Q1695_015608 [Nippostrongylus brasiliensis]|nr:hypothetical protein Q1695_015608 [Nippostrongylus brasiliensis]